METSNSRNIFSRIGGYIREHSFVYWSVVVVLIALFLMAICFGTGDVPERDSYGGELSEAHRMLPMDMPEGEDNMDRPRICADPYDGGIVGDTVREGWENGYAVSGDASGTAAEESASLPFFADPMEMFEVAGDVYDRFLDADRSGDIEEAVRMLVSSVLWFLFAVFVLFLWVVLPFFAVLVMLRVAVALWRLLGRLWWGDWGSRGFRSDRKLCEAVETMRGELETMRRNKSRIPMEAFSEYESERLREKYPDAPVVWVDWVSEEELQGFAEWCCRKAEEIFADDMEKLKWMLEQLRCGSAWCLRVFDLLVQDADRMSVWEVVSKPYFQYHALRLREPQYETLIATEKEDSGKASSDDDGWPEPDGDAYGAAVQTDGPEKDADRRVSIRATDRASWIARAEAEFADDCWMRDNMVLWAEEREDLFCYEKKYQDMSEQFAALRVKYPDCVSPRSDLRGFWCWCIRNSAAVDDDFRKDIIESIHHNGIWSIGDYDDRLLSHLERKEKKRKTSEFFDDTSALPEDIRTYVEAENERCVRIEKSLKKLFVNKENMTEPPDEDKEQKGTQEH